jgi:hypothetical protein
MMTPFFNEEEEKKAKKKAEKKDHVTLLHWQAMGSSVIRGSLLIKVILPPLTLEEFFVFTAKVMILLSLTLKEFFVCTRSAASVNYSMLTCGSKINLNVSKK